MSAPTPSSPLHLAVLASRQIMPNLESIVALAATGRLKGVHIYWTDFQDSRRAAPAMARVLKSVSGRAPFSGFAVHCSEVPGSGQLEDVVAWASRAIARWPGCRWVLNATGGTKPMAAGLLVLAGHAAVEAVLYRELSARSWSVLSPAPDEPGRFATCAPPAGYALDRAGELLDRIPLAELLRAQLGVADLRIDPNPAGSLKADQLDRWIAWLDPGARRPYTEAWAEAGLQDQGSVGEGQRFERLFHGVLSRFGFGGLAHSVEVRRDAPGEKLPAHNELDFVVRHKGRIRVLDLKLTGPSGPSLPAFDQIRTVAEATRVLGGIDAKAIMLRPNWPPRPELEDYARRAHSVQIVDGTGMPRFFDALAKDLDYSGALPDSAQRLQAFFARRLALGLPSAGASASLPRSEPGLPLIGLQEELHQAHQLRQSHWAAASLGEGVLLSLDWKLPFDPQGTDLAERLRTLRSGRAGFTITVFTFTDQVGLLAIRGLGRAGWASELAAWTPRLRDSRAALRKLLR